MPVILEGTLLKPAKDDGSARNAGPAMINAMVSVELFLDMFWFTKY